MDARPNVLNKILPCTKHTLLETQGSTGENVWPNYVYGRALDDSSPENLILVGRVPQDYIEGSDFNLVISCCGAIDNPEGADKKVKLLTKYAFARDGFTLVSPVTDTPVLVTIPDGQPRRTIQTVTIITITDLKIADVIGILIERDANHTDDTYVGDFIIFRPSIGQYITDKIGAL